VPDQVEIAFDDQRAVASAGLLLPATLAEQLGIDQVTDQVVDLGDRSGRAHPGRKLLTLVQAIVAGGDCIDDVQLLQVHPGGVWPSGDGALHGGGLPALVDLRPRPPARPADRDDPQPNVGGRTGLAMAP
jgi:hypothetical protein